MVYAKFTRQVRIPSTGIDVKVRVIPSLRRSKISGSSFAWNQTTNLENYTIELAFMAFVRMTLRSSCSHC